MNDMRSYQDFIKTIQSKGIYVFSKKEALQQIDTQEASLKVTLARNVRLKNIVYLGQHLYGIVPPEYKNWGAPPPEWYIDQLMQAHAAHYYVGLLTAASFHGAAHQAPQIFQVICDKRLPQVIIGRSTIRFYFSQQVASLPYQTKNAPTGTLKISTPEVTAFDLMKYLRQSGHINHVATVLLELGNNLKARELGKVAESYSPAYVQRLGYVLDELGYVRKTQLLHDFIEKQLPPRYVPLRSDRKQELSPKNKKWHIVINEKLEPDTL
jgi:predicted transcriptional regulator of viral defense system